ncbi:MAG: hypothetical protein ABF741_11015 [Liquorilactobacillus ghanensis]|uniref:hypothetical protein n=1 Tax=Liquorilactobacillus ghanensis TaxID=399370 RepID=UPI0039E8331D
MKLRIQAKRIKRLEEENLILKKCDSAGKILRKPLQKMAASYHYVIKKEATQKLANLLNQDFSTNEINQIGVICQQLWTCILIIIGYYDGYRFGAAHLGPGS